MQATSPRGCPTILGHSQGAGLISALIFFVRNQARSASGVPFRAFWTPLRFASWLTTSIFVRALISPAREFLLLTKSAFAVEYGRSRRSGGTGRRAAFRAQWPYGRVGSTPTSGIAARTDRFGRFCFEGNAGGKRTTTGSISRPGGAGGTGVPEPVGRSQSLSGCSGTPRPGAPVAVPPGPGRR